MLQGTGIMGLKAKEICSNW